MTELSPHRRIVGGRRSDGAVEGGESRTRANTPDE